MRGSADIAPVNAVDREGFGKIAKSSHPILGTGNRSKR